MVVGIREETPTDWIGRSGIEGGECDEGTAGKTLHREHVYHTPSADRKRAQCSWEQVFPKNLRNMITKISHVSKPLYRSNDGYP